MRAPSFNIVEIAERYSEAVVLLKQPGDCAIIERGGLRRQIIIFCPDGCGERLSINLDPGSGRAWQLYQRRGMWSLFPSIDKTSGCLSHFILWSGRILWCDFQGSGTEPEWPHEFADDVLKAIDRHGSVHYLRVAEELDEVPWDILAVCRHLVCKGLLIEGKDLDRSVFTIARNSG